IHLIGALTADRIYYKKILSDLSLLREQGVEEMNDFKKLQTGCFAASRFHSRVFRFGFCLSGGIYLDSQYIK
ncbi:MAG: hypothetical protein IJM10_09710, partial [Clostridia bacterium]|nr:hypothetical protein [Clostridia bacterium]